ncbi:MAG TPA: glycoside hydrolase family 88 protein [Terriglobales bacterium]|nr:glycoside hydrolase family 88 protein [Terriglobales bacterium]
MESISVHLAKKYFSALDRDCRQIPSNPYAPKSRFDKRSKYYLMRLALLIAKIAERKSFKQDWYHACYTKALVSAHRNGNADALTILISVFDRQIASNGYLSRGVEQPFQVMGGYSLCYARESCPDASRFDLPLKILFDTLRNGPKTPGGGILYKAGTSEVYVDTIGMICPFLAYYARLTSDKNALNLCSDHVLAFIARNIDAETHLPFHAYHDPGASRLGLHGWGRGTGWYVLGLCDIAAELIDEDKLKNTIVAEIQHVAQSLKRFQKPNGNWATQIPVPEGPDDLSATAFCAYGLARAMRLGILDSSFSRTLGEAIAALAKNTDAHGQLRNSSAEAYGVGSYGLTRGIQPWGNGIAAAAVFESVGLLTTKSDKNDCT